MCTVSWKHLQMPDQVPNMQLLISLSTYGSTHSCVKTGLLWRSPSVGTQQIRRPASLEKGVKWGFWVGKERRQSWNTYIPKYTRAAQGPQQSEVIATRARNETTSQKFRNQANSSHLSWQILVGPKEGKPQIIHCIFTICVEKTRNGISYVHGCIPPCWNLI